MQKKLLIAAALSMAILYGWDRWVMPKPVRPATPSSGSGALPPPGTPAAQTSAEPPLAAPVPREGLPPPVRGASLSSTTIQNSVVRATFSNRGAVLTSIVLLKHTDDQGEPLELVRSLPSSAPRPLALEFPGREELTRQTGEALFVVEQESDRAVRFRFADAAVAITKEIRLRETYLLDVQVRVVGPDYTLFAGTGLRNPTEREKASTYAMPAGAVAATGGGLAREAPDKIKQREVWPLDPGGFAGLEDNYFLAVLVPKQPARAVALPVPGKDASGKPDNAIAAGVSGQGRLDLQAYFGPKDIEILEGLKLGLERAVDFGWFGILARPLLWLVKKAYAWVGNYGVAILLVTLLIRILLFPLMHKSYASMKKMQKLAPKMNVIRDKYKKAKTDAAQRSKMNQELMALYQAEGYNPMSGCLPLLLQMPIFIAFYNVLSHAAELRHAPFVLWIRDLAGVDHTYVLVILMTITMYIQQAMTPTTVDPMQKRIFMAMPLIMGFFMRLAPSGLVLYWLFSNVLTIFQQMLINRIGRKDDEPQNPKSIRNSKVEKSKIESGKRRERVGNAI